MHSVKFAALIIAGTAATNTISKCDIPNTSTVYVTVPAQAVTKTVFITHHKYEPTQVKSASGILDIEEVSLKTATETEFVTSTNFVTVTRTASDKNDKGPFSFADEAGTTVWLADKTPPSSLTFTVKTSDVQIQPVPVASFATTTDSPKSLDHSDTPKKAYTRHGSTGWNSTASNLALGSTGSATSANAAGEKDVVLTGALTSTIDPSPLPKRRYKARDAGDLVFAEVDGVLVSWTNQYSGFTPEITSGTSELSHTSTLPPGSSTMSFAPSITLSPYAWENPSTPGSAPLNATTTSVQISDASTCPDSPDPTFVIDFDDLPHFSISSNIETHDVPPIFNPYRKLYWQGQFGYVPPPSDPYPPISPPQLAIYRARITGAQGSPGAGLELPGEVGSGPRASASAYWFDAHSLWLGCSNGGQVHCIATITGYTNGDSAPNVSHTIAIDPCFGLRGCVLTQVELPDDFRSLTGLQIIATIAGEVVDYYMDNLKLSWSDNSCSAQQQRSSAE